ncbi:hypothetical protein AAFX91_12080 [Bradyrhizobium sp. 31Argb]|uniref:hypothetical protein n=1 Tax=unclassified Bradyrhizobium TaxID=2631580 RepID=UPI001A91540C|nr:MULTISPECIES: hypothetical protein [unclassified Bradyrhizobium]MDI4233758.1 hypothetical protein [Bradyrhizobium sp. Arg237L]
MTNRAYEPLTAENAALVLVDHQIGLMTGVRDISTGELGHARRPDRRRHAQVSDRSIPNNRGHRQ